MCGLCGSLGHGPAWETDASAGLTHERWRLRREAQETAALLTRLLRPARVTIDASPDFGFLIQSPTGGTTAAAGVSGVWHALAAAGIAIPDPLET